MGTEEDIISNKLPESLISYILSLVPTKDAVRTCVLSKTWLNRWISITKLDLDDGMSKMGVCFHCKCVFTEIKNCSWSSAKYIFIEAPLLEVISIEQDIHFYYNLVSSDLSLGDIKFSTTHLKEFTYRGLDIIQKISLSDCSFLSHIVSANIIFEQCVNKDLALLFLQQLCGVTCIKLERLEVLSPIDIPLFAKLSHLEVSLVTIEVLLGLLQKSPVLKTLIFKEILIFDEELLTSVDVPICVASTLQIVKFEKVNGDDHEFSLAKFFMEKCTTLERMSYSHLLLKGH